MWRYLVIGIALMGWMVLSGCYGHTPVKTPRQLEAGEVSGSAQMRVPGWFVVPGAALLGQYGLGAGDVGGQVGVGAQNAYGGAFGRVYPTSFLNVGVEATYLHVFTEYNQDHYDMVRPDFDHNLTAAVDVVGHFEAGKYRIYGGPKGQAVWWIPDGARQEYDLPPEKQRTQFEGFTAGLLGGAERTLNDKMSLQAEIMFLPVGSYQNFDGDALDENRLQVTFGLNFR
ncbi:MAG: hypothetical protein ACOCV2_14745 [Persicimonas sp.]